MTPVNAVDAIDLMAVLARLYEQRPEVMKLVCDFLASPPNIGTISIRFRDGKLHSAEQSSVVH